MVIMTAYSKNCDCTTRKHYSLKTLIGSTGMSFGSVIISNLMILTHSFWESVKSAEPYLFLIYSLNLSTMTETNRLTMKNVTMKIYKTYRRLTNGEFFSLGVKS